MTIHGRSVRQWGAAALALISGVMLFWVGATYASWSASTIDSSATIQSGALAADEVPSMYHWSSDGVGGQGGGSGNSATTLSQYTLMPGSELTVSDTFSTRLEGDNLQAVLKVSDSDSQLPSGVTAFDSVAPLGQSGATEVPLNTAYADMSVPSGFNFWTVTVRIVVDANATSAGSTASIGDLTLTLDQIREG